MLKFPRRLDQNRDWIQQTQEYDEIWQSAYKVKREGEGSRERETISTTNAMQETSAALLIHVRGFSKCKLDQLSISESYLSLSAERKGLLGSLQMQWTGRFI